MTSFARIAALSGIALAAGFAGSLVMLGSQQAEMKATGRAPSDTPAKAIETLTGTDVPGDRDEARLSTAGHFAFGTALGLGLVALDRIDEPWRTPLFAGGAWVVGTSVLIALGLSEPPTRWKASELAIDLGHHAVYGAATATALAQGRRLAGI